MIRLDGKIALVTGAASGIGHDIARSFATLGAIVEASDLNEEGLKGAAGDFGPDVALHRHDVGDEADWQRVMDDIRSRHGRLDVLVNCAGIMLSRNFVDAPVAWLHRQQRVNVDSVYIGMHAAIPLMKAGGGSIINIASVYGKVGGERYAAYSATKGAVRALSKAVAAELAASGVRVNCVLPGPVATNLGASWDPPTDAEGRPLSPEEALASWTRLIPLGRLGQATDIAPLVAYLASDLSAFVTGAEFVADGGYTAV